MTYFTFFLGAYEINRHLSLEQKREKRSRSKLFNADREKLSQKNLSTVPNCTLRKNKLRVILRDLERKFVY